MNGDSREIEAAADTALTQFARGVLEAAGTIGAAVFGRDDAAAGAREVATKAADAFQHDLTGHLVDEIDAHGLSISNVDVKTELAAFAQGKANAPIESVSAHVDKTLDLPELQTGVGSITTSCTLTLTVTYRRGDRNQKPMTTVAKVALDIVYDSSSGT
jgi:hypothetical protein